MGMKSAIGSFAVRHAVSIVFLVVALCFGGAYAARKMGSSVFPETDFPRVVIMVNNGVMPVDEMMATVTRPIEEAMKDILGSETRNTVARHELVEMIRTTKDRKAAVDDTLCTSNPRVFAAGDVMFKPGGTDAMVVEAAQRGKQAAYSADLLLRSEAR